MRSPGSVLIVVLGLLAILAVVGLAFVTMSNIDRSTAANFALQSQFMLAADGAVDYVCYHMVPDLWEYDTTLSPPYWKAGNRLLTGFNTGSGKELVSCEPFDWPGTLSDGSKPDPWLATPCEGPHLPAGAQYSYYYSYGTTASVSPYGLLSWGTNTPNTDRPNNLGFPDDSGKVPIYTSLIAGGTTGHGVWIPELSFPFETGLIRVSVTVQDHGAMVNLNAHGNTTGQPGDLFDTINKGYYLSDVDSSTTDLGFNVVNLLMSTTPPGLWSSANANKVNTMQAVIENPKIYGDKPFTLDEEFELRRLIGTAFTSRLENFCSTLASTPTSATSATAKKRLYLTTVGWTSEACGDVQTAFVSNSIHITPSAFNNATLMPDPPTGRRTIYPSTADWSMRKADLNLDDPEVIYQALLYGRAIASGQENKFKQLAANIFAFRKKTTAAALGFEVITAGGTLPSTAGMQLVGAARQPLFSEISATVVRGTPANKDTWTVRVEAYNPWHGDFAGATTGLTTTGMTVTATAGTGCTATVTAPATVTSPMAYNACQVFTITAVSAGLNSTLNTVLTAVKLGLAVGGRNVPLDQILAADLGTAAMNKYRPIYVESEKRSTSDPLSTDVLYVGDWLTGTNGTMGTLVMTWPAIKIPIRFPRSVDVNYAIETTRTKPLPPRATATTGTDAAFRAFARLGDLDQVLMFAPNTAGDWWAKPWVISVTQDIAGNVANEVNVKFNWDDAVPAINGISRLNAANVLTAGGPWFDKLDNDGDGYADDYGASLGADTGKSGAGMFGGPELRVAGRINLNTAPAFVIGALEKGVIPLPAGTLQTYLLAAKTAGVATGGAYMRSPAQILKGTVGMNDTTFKGFVEPRDNYVFNRLSNIATVRSDTFSIYGTVQYGRMTYPSSTATFTLVRSRRFWALVDRSPSLAYSPTQTAFIHPRVLNFQWLD